MHGITHKVGGDVNHVLRNVSSLSIVAANQFQSTVGREFGVLDRGCDSPAESKSVRDTGIQALTPVDRMDVGGISCEKNTAAALLCYKSGSDSFLDCVMSHHPVSGKSIHEDNTV